MTADAATETSRSPATAGTGAEASPRAGRSRQDPVTSEAFDTNRWVGVAGVAAAAIGIGVLVRQPALLLVAVVAIGYAAARHAGDAPTPALAVDRSLSDDTPVPEDKVTVTVTVRNEGEALLSDLRLVDGVPPGLEVVDGPARAATAIRPGTAVTFTYTVRAVRGAHEWEPLSAITRSPSGARERDTRFAVPTTLRCSPRFTDATALPLRGLTTQYAGRVPTDVGGSGVEFHSTRAYRTGDPLRRVDWNRYARTRELTTLDLREERAATVVLLVDCREAAYRSPGPEAENAVERSVDAAGQVFAGLSGSGDRVGLAAYGPIDCWVSPGTGADHEQAVRTALATHDAFAPTPPSDRFLAILWLRRARRRLSADAQVLFFSPLCDDAPVDTARRLDAAGHLVTVVSPDPTADDTAGRQLAAIERRNRISTLRRGGIRVVDWRAEPLAVAVATADRRWSR